MERTTSFADEFSQAKKIAEDYIFAYFQHLSKPEERSHLRRFYRESSTVLWNEYHQHGQDAIAEFFESVVFQDAHLTKTSFRVCPGGANGGVMVVVTGRMNVDGFNHEIVEAFYLEKADDHEEDFYISSQILTLLGGDEMTKGISVY